MSPRTRCRSHISACLWLCCLLCFSACNLQQRAASGSLPTNTPDGPPQIRIVSPRGGDEFALGEEILVSVEASDSIGVNRVQLFVNDQIVRTVSSESLQGDLSMGAILNYVTQADDVGTISLSVLAYRGAEVSAPDVISVAVRLSPADVIATPANPANIPLIPDDGVCRARINVALNFRTGPSTLFDRITVLSSGTLAPVRGRNEAGTWWQLDYKDRLGWVSADFTSEYGDCSAVSVASG